MSFFYKLSIDITSPDYISGWCFQRWNKNQPVQLQLYQGDILLGEVTADQNREDLAALQIHPSGECGFEFIIDSLPLSEKEGSWLLREKKSQSILAVIDHQQATTPKVSKPLHFLRKTLKRAGKKDPTILFMHIPKTAGTSFNTLVRSLLPPEQVISHIEAVDEKNYAQLQNRYRFISGHLRYGVFRKQLSHSNTKIFSIIREPYSHLHSHLKWMAVTASDVPDSSPKFRNQVIHRIARRVGETDFNNPDDIEKFVQDIRVIGAPFFDNMQTRHFLDDYVEKVTENDLKDAISNSHSFELIGLTEEYPEFIRRFSEINNLKPPGRSSTLNRSSSPPLFDFHDPTVRDLFSPLVCHDLKLHNHIRKISRGKFCQTA